MAMQAGHELDRAVHLTVFGNAAGKIPAYSTDEKVAMRLLDRLPLFVASLSPDHGKFDPQRPFVAGQLIWNGSLGADASRLRVTSSDKLVALCKAALLLVSQRTKAPGAAPAQTNLPRQPKIAVSRDAARIPIPKRIVGTPPTATPQPPSNATPA